MIGQMQGVFMQENQVTHLSYSEYFAKFRMQVKKITERVATKSFAHTTLFIRHVPFTAIGINAHALMRWGWTTSFTTTGINPHAFMWWGWTTSYCKYRIHNLSKFLFTITVTRTSLFVVLGYVHNVYLMSIEHQKKVPFVYNKHSQVPIY